jgi:hypothetical protein
VATIIEALEELYPLPAEHKHLDLGSRWQQVIDNSVRRVRIQADNMEQARRDPPTPPRSTNAYEADPRRRRDRDRRDNDSGRGGRGGSEDREDHGGCEGRGHVHWGRDKGTPCLTSIITHLTCNCGDTDINSTYRQWLISMRYSTTYFTALTLFDTGAYTSFVNREVAKWLEVRQHGGTVAGVHQTRSSRHDIPTSEVGN